MGKEEMVIKMKKLTAVALCLLMGFLFFGCGKQTQRSETDEINALKETYPEYFDLSTSKGLEVYVWQIVPNSYSFGVLPGTNREKTYEELLRLKGVSAEEMLVILSSYDIDEDNIFIIPWQNPVSSYIPEYWIRQKDEDPASVEKRQRAYLDGIRNMLFAAPDTMTE